MRHQENDRPIFVGGTGRSGTTLMGRFLDSHKSIITPVPENKLIVEHDGLRTLIECLSGGFDFKGNSQSIQRFLEWAAVLRRSGVRNEFARTLYRASNKAVFTFTRKRIPLEWVGRAFPGLDISIVGVGEKFGLEHYDRCVAQFVGRIVSDRDEYGVFDTEGLVRPVFLASVFDKEKLLEEARAFLYDLIEPKLKEAGVSRWCDDTPMNVHYSDFLTSLYPECRIIHMVRDPRDVVASYIGQSWASSNLDLTLKRLRESYVSLIEVERTVPDTSLMTVRLEDFVNHHEATVDKLSRFVEIDPNGFKQGFGLSDKSFGRWKDEFSAEDTAKVESVLGPAISYYGYQ